MKRLADLETSHVTQTTHEQHGKGPWVLYNEERVEIHRFPKEWNEKQVMAAIHFGRKFERIALNAGMEAERKKAPQQVADLRILVGRQNTDILALKEECDKLANELDKLTLKYEV